MDRGVWLKEKRKLAEERYDKIFSINYDENWGRINEVHKNNIIEFCDLLPKGERILDAACGTGKYWTIIKNNGQRVVGIDQSQEMLNKARVKHCDVHIRKLGLQEIDYEKEFYGIICMDAMENIFPEEWGKVLSNFYKALKDGGLLYFTVELLEEKEMLEAYKKGIEMGLPIVKGEFVHEGGYHYYPELDLAKNWISEAGFSVLKEDISEGYHHFVVKKESNLIKVRQAKLDEAQRLTNLSTSPEAKEFYIKWEL